MEENSQNNQENTIEEPDFGTQTDNATENAASGSEQVIDPVEDVKLQLAEMKDKYLRLYAEFENFRRRTSKEKIELIGNANADLMKSILPVADDFERAIVSFERASEIEPLREGVALIYNKLFKTLESKGLKPMETIGKAFDADLHESVAQFPSPNEEQKGKVIDEVEKGYYLGDKVIRFAKVVVGV